MYLKTTRGIEMTGKKIVDAERALRERRAELDDSPTARRRRKRKQLEEQGLCNQCGNKELTDHEKKKGYVRCYKCRYKHRKRY